jgi:hypothetical protein
MVEKKITSKSVLTQTSMMGFSTEKIPQQRWYWK